MISIFFNKAKTLLDVHAQSLHPVNQKVKMYAQHKVKWELVLKNLQEDFNGTNFQMKKNELKLAEAQASSASWQNKAILALSQGLIELAKNAFIHKSYYDTYIQELLVEKELLADQLNLKKAELYKVTFRVNHMKKYTKSKNGSQSTYKNLMYKPKKFWFDSENKIHNSGEDEHIVASISNYSHMICKFD